MDLKIAKIGLTAFLIKSTVHFQPLSPKRRSLKSREKVAGNHVDIYENPATNEDLDNSAASSTPQSDRLGQASRERGKCLIRECMLARLLSTISEEDLALRLTLSIKGLDVQSAPRTIGRAGLRAMSLR